MPIILLMLLGYLLKTIKFLTPEFLKIGNKTVFYVLLPVMLYKNISDIKDISQIRMDVIYYVLGAITVLAVAGFILQLFVSEPKQKGVIHQCVFRSNFALIGVPLAELMGGDNGVLMAAVISLFSIPIFNVLAVIVLSVYKDGKIKLNIKKILLDIVKNPLIIGVLSGLIVAFFKFLMTKHGVANPLTKVTFLYTVVSYLARAATPIALIVLGGQFDLQRMSGYKKQLIVGLAGRNFIAPLIGVGGAVILTLTGHLNFGPDVFAALIALFGTPVAVASAIMAEAMDNDGQLAGQLVVWTTILSLITLFVVIFIVPSVASYSLGIN